MFSRCHILLTVDVEDWFQVENLKSAIPFESWPSRELRVEKNTHQLLDLFDEISGQRSSGQNTEGESQKTGDRTANTESGKTQSSVLRLQSSDFPTSGFYPQAQRSSIEAILQPSSPIRATFFVLGWIAGRLPNLVREIYSRGHEVASHGYHHDLCSDISGVELRRDLLDSKKLLEDIVGQEIYGYRAPSFSVSDDILKMIADAGYQYDSSYNSFVMHGRYGKISLNGIRRSGIAYHVSEGFYELPISNLKLGKKILPWGGGAYFRLIPAPVFRIGVREILRQQQAYIFYMHPWEVDPEQPRPEGITAFSRLRHYTNLSRTEGRLRSLFQEFRECRFVSCREHLQANGGECWNTEYWNTV
jgi:polysaccharide deacetylase family protein (PEP-CTERM system associated)